MKKKKENQFKKGFYFLFFHNFFHDDNKNTNIILVKIRVICRKYNIKIYQNMKKCKTM